MTELQLIKQQVKLLKQQVKLLTNQNKQQQQFIDLLLKKPTAEPTKKTTHEAQRPPRKKILDADLLDALDEAEDIYSTL